MAEPDTDPDADPAPLTRRELRERARRARGTSAPAPRGPGAARRGAGPQRARPSVRLTRARPLLIGSTVALAALVALSGYAHPFVLASAVALGGLVVAWGWPPLLGLPSRRGASGALAVAAVCCVVSVAATTEDPFLRWLPAGVALSILAVFLHELLRRDGRPRLTESIGAATVALGTIASGAAYVALPRTWHGADPLAAAMAALALSVLADLMVTRGRLRAWALPVAIVLGGGASSLTFLALGRHEVSAIALLGMLVAAVAHALRRVLAVLPGMAAARSQLVSGAASVLVCGALVYVVARLALA